MKLINHFVAIAMLATATACGSSNNSEESTTAEVETTSEAMNETVEEADEESVEEETETTERVEPPYNKKWDKKLDRLEKKVKDLSKRVEKLGEDEGLLQIQNAAQKIQEDLDEIPQDELTKEQLDRHQLIVADLAIITAKMAGKTVGALFGL